MTRLSEREDLRPVLIKWIFDPSVLLMWSNPLCPWWRQHLLQLLLSVTVSAVLLWTLPLKHRFEDVPVCNFSGLSRPSVRLQPPSRSPSSLSFCVDAPWFAGILGPSHSTQRHTWPIVGGSSLISVHSPVGRVEKPLSAVNDLCGVITSSLW